MSDCTCTDLACPNHLAEVCGFPEHDPRACGGCWDCCDAQQSLEAREWEEEHSSHEPHPPEVMGVDWNF